MRNNVLKNHIVESHNEKQLSELEYKKRHCFYTIPLIFLRFLWWNFGGEPIHFQSFHLFYVASKCGQINVFTSNASSELLPLNSSRWFRGNIIYNPIHLVDFLGDSFADFVQYIPINSCPIRRHSINRMHRTNTDRIII